MTFGEDLVAAIVRMQPADCILDRMLLLQLQDTADWLEQQVAMLADDRVLTDALDAVEELEDVEVG